MSELVDLVERAPRSGLFFDHSNVFRDEENCNDEDWPRGVCGRWRDDKLTNSCSLAGTEECDFECPYR